MAFKTVKDYNEAKFGGLFVLRNDRDYADVIILYRDINDVLVGDVHYIKSAEYSGYVHCCGAGCPACAKGIRVQTRLFIPVYNIDAHEIQFFDRTMRFEPQLQQDVFSRFPNPSEYVFRITRHGAAGDVNTTYQIAAVGKNTVKSYDTIMTENNTEFPNHYEAICKTMSAAKLSSMLNTPTDTAYSNMPEYQVTPRVSAPAPRSTGDVPPTFGSTTSFENIGSEVMPSEPTDNDVPDEVPDDVVF